MKPQKRKTRKAGPLKFIGPYRVLVRHNDNHTIRGVYADRNVQTVHVNRLKLAHLRFDDAYPHNNDNEVPTNTDHTAPPFVAGNRTSDEADRTTEPEPLPRYNLRSSKK
jgi:hypothetical protein